MNKKAFTLIELMIVVAIIGILASVAIPSFLRFLKKSKSSEAPINIKSIVMGAISWYQDEHTDSVGSPMPRHFPGLTSPHAHPTSSAQAITTPTNAPCGASSAGALYIKNSQQWDIQPWKSLKFSVNKAHYYQYFYDTIETNQDANISFFARGDLDCDGTLAFMGGNVNINSVSGEAEITGMKILNELE